MDKGTNAKDMLMGRIIKLKLGYVGVKGRSQEDIQNNVSAKKGIDIEKSYFARHKIYATMPKKYLGTSSLVGSMTTIFYKHIRGFLPSIIKEINGKARDCKDKLKDLGPPLPHDAQDKLHLLWNMVTAFCESFKNQILGKYDNRRSVRLKNQKYTTGALIRIEFNRLFKNLCARKYKATAKYTDHEI